jgi:transitional endoplasmic reticulum ATPase
MDSTASPAATLQLRVAEARVEDVGRAIARLAPADLVRLGARPNDVVKIVGRTTAVARAVPWDSTPEGMIAIDGTARSNCGAGLQDQVSVSAVEHASAVAVRLTPSWVGAPPAIIGPDRMLDDLADVPVITGCVVRVPTFAKAVNFQIVRTIPSGPVVIGPRTDLRIVEGEQSAAPAPAVSYEDIGGLEREVARVREIVELPLRHARVFERLGVLPPKGVLLYGPPGTGKTLLARAVAAESRVHFIHLNGPEIMRKFYGESEAKLREVFEDAVRRAPAILFIDEIDAVAPKRAEVTGEVEKRVVAQLLSLMDGFVSRGQVVVMGATNIPEVLDPALRRPGRFDREIEIGVPNTQARLQILKIHTRAMPLGVDVNLPEIAEHSHGFVGADLEALCQEVGMIALRRFLSAAPLIDQMGDAELATLVVTQADFLAGLKEVEPSATREFYIEKSASTFASLGGLDDVKALLASVVEHAHRRDDIYEQVGLTPPRGILLVGPSGTGKTSMARALAGEQQLPLITIDGPQLYSKWLGESEKALRDVFKRARRAAPCLLFFDTIDAIAPKPSLDGSEGSGIYARILSQLVREIDNLRDLKGVILVGATNRPERVDPTLLRRGRFDYIVRFMKPDRVGRAEILKLCCRRVPLATDVDVERLAGDTDGLTGADLESACKKATLLAIAEFQRGGRGRTFEVRVSDFAAVLDVGLDPSTPRDPQGRPEPSRGTTGSGSS